MSSRRRHEQINISSTLLASVLSKETCLDPVLWHKLEHRGKHCMYIPFTTSGNNCHGVARINAETLTLAIKACRTRLGAERVARDERLILLGVDLKSFQVSKPFPSENTIYYKDQLFSRLVLHKLAFIVPLFDTLLR